MLSAKKDVGISDIDSHSLKIQAAMHNRDKRPDANQELLNKLTVDLADGEDVFRLMQEANIKDIFGPGDKYGGEIIPYISETYHDHHHMIKLFQEDYHSELDSYFSSKNDFSFRRTRNLAVRVALGEYLVHPEYIERKNFYTDAFEEPELSFLDYCEEQDIDYPNFALLEIERFLITNWYAVHPRNFLSIMIFLALKNIERILFIDLVLETMKTGQESGQIPKSLKQKGKNGIEYRLDKPTSVTQKELEGLAETYLLNVEKFNPDLQHYFKDKFLNKEFKKEEVEQAFLEFIINFQKFTFVDGVNEIWKMSSTGLYSNIPYQKVWDFIMNCTSHGVDMHVLVVALLSIMEMDGEVHISGQIVRESGNEHPKEIGQTETERIQKHFILRPHLYKNFSDFNDIKVNPNFFDEDNFDSAENPVLEDTLILSCYFGISKRVGINLLWAVKRMYVHSLEHGGTEEVYDHDYFFENLQLMNKYFGKEDQFSELPETYFHKFPRLKFHIGSFLDIPPSDPKIWMYSLFPSLPVVARFDDSLEGTVRDRQRIFLLNFFEIDFINYDGSKKAEAVVIMGIYFDVYAEYEEDYDKNFTEHEYNIKNDTFQSGIDYKRAMPPDTKHFERLKNGYVEVFEETLMNIRLFFILTVGVYKVKLVSPNAQLEAWNSPFTSWDTFEDFIEIMTNFFVNDFDFKHNLDWLDMTKQQIDVQLSPWKDGNPYPHEFDFDNEILSTEMKSRIAERREQVREDAKSRYAKDYSIPVEEIIQIDINHISDLTEISEDLRAADFDVLNEFVFTYMDEDEDQVIQSMGYVKREVENVEFEEFKMVHQKNYLSSNQEIIKQYVEKQEHVENPLSSDIPQEVEQALKEILPSLRIRPGIPYPQSDDFDEILNFFFYYIYIFKLRFGWRIFGKSDFYFMFKIAMMKHSTEIIKDHALCLKSLKNPDFNEQATELIEEQLGKCFWPYSGQKTFLMTYNIRFAPIRRMLLQTHIEPKRSRKAAVSKNKVGLVSRFMNLFL